MTAIGLIAGSDRAIAWADTLFFRDGEPAGEHAKLAVNRTARMIGLGTGNAALCQLGRGAIANCCDVHDVVARLPGAFATKARRIAIELDEPARCWFLAAGWSPRWRRIVAFELGAPSYRPLPTSAFASPPIALGGMFEPTFDDVRGTARQQIAQVGIDHGCVMTGRVDAVSLTRDGIDECVLLDLEDSFSELPGRAGREEAAATLSRLSSPSRCRSVAADAEQGS